MAFLSAYSPGKPKTSKYPVFEITLLVPTNNSLFAFASNLTTSNSAGG